MAPLAPETKQQKENMTCKIKFLTTAKKLAVVNY